MHVRFCVASPSALFCVADAGSCFAHCISRVSPLQAQAKRLGIQDSGKLERNSLVRVLMETEELAELSFPSPPKWKEFEGACKKKLGKPLTFEYFPGSTGPCKMGEGGTAAPGGSEAAGAGVSQKQSPRGTHVKDDKSMQACMEWLMQQPRPGQEMVDKNKERGKSQEDAPDLKVPDLVLPCVLAVELLPSELDADKIWLDAFDGKARSSNAWLASIQLRRTDSWQDVSDVLTHKFRAQAATGFAFAYVSPWTGAVGQVSQSGTGWQELRDAAAAVPNRHMEVDIYFGLTSKTWTVTDLPRTEVVKRLQIGNPWHKHLVLVTHSDQPHLIRPRDPAVSLRPHPATADLFVHFMRGEEQEQGSGGERSAIVTLTLRARRTSATLQHGGVGDATSCGKDGASATTLSAKSPHDVHGNEELTIRIHASWS
jgi:hypothetical protein